MMQWQIPRPFQESRRHLRANTMLYAAAEEACSKSNSGDLELCIDDIMITGEVGLADIW